jgi:hypothetical protein
MSELFERMAMTEIFPIEQTTPPVAEGVANYLLKAAEGEIFRRAAEHVEQWKQFWQHPTATPANVAASMGQNAGRWFAIAAINKQSFLQAEQVLGVQIIDPLFLTTPQNVTVHSDGSATLSAI